MKKKVIIEFISTALVILFIYASVSKLSGFQVYSRQMLNQGFPIWFTKVIIWLVPLAEILASLALVIGSLTLKNKMINLKLSGFYASAIILSVFTLYIISVLLHWYYNYPCSCGGVISKLTWRQHLVFNLTFLTLCLIGIRLQRSKEKILVKRLR